MISMYVCCQCIPAVGLRSVTTLFWFAECSLFCGQWVTMDHKLQLYLLSLFLLCMMCVVPCCCSLSVVITYEHAYHDYMYLYACLAPGSKLHAMYVLLCVHCMHTYMCVCTYILCYSSDCLCLSVSLSVCLSVCCGCSPTRAALDQIRDLPAMPPELRAGEGCANV